MLDLKVVRESADLVRKALISRNNKEIDLDAFLELDKKRRKLLSKIDELRTKKNTASEEIGVLVKQKEDAKDKIAAMKKVSLQIAELEPQARDVDSKVQDILMRIPNIPHISVPVGGIDKNKEVNSWGKQRKFDFKPKSHIELAESLDIIDFKRAAKITGSNFIVFKKDGARLERALYNFMLDVHTKDHGYNEVAPPLLVNRASMTGTGQLPKMEDDMYQLAGEDYFLIPTAEVPVTNLHREEILRQEDLPIYYAAYTACFRREAGSYGKDTRGLVRVHQFDKVELVKFVKPESSYDELGKLVADAQKILQLLEIPYRVIILATGDLSFASAKTYDIEGYAPGIDSWLEISSCSNFEDFQARRASIRYKDPTTNKTAFVHTLNGSGVALARTMVAVLENYQTKEGQIEIPKVLQPYMGGKKKISA